MWNAIDFIGKAFGLKHGVEFIEVDPKEVPKWQAAVEPVITDYVKRMVGKGYSEEEVRGWIKFCQERSDFWKQKQLTYHIPSAAGPADLKPEAFVLGK